MSGRVLYGAGGEVLVDTAREALVEEHLANLTTAVMLLLQAHGAVVEASLHQGLTPDQRRNVGEHLAEVQEVQEQLLRGAMVLFAGRLDGQ